MCPDRIEKWSSNYGTAERWNQPTISFTRIVVILEGPNNPSELLLLHIVFELGVFSGLVKLVMVIIIIIAQLKLAD